MPLLDVVRKRASKKFRNRCKRTSKGRQEGIFNRQHSLEDVPRWRRYQVGNFRSWPGSVGSRLLVFVAVHVTGMKVSAGCEDGPYPGRSNFIEGKTV